MPSSASPMPASPMAASPNDASPMEASIMPPPARPDSPMEASLMAASAAAEAAPATGRQAARKSRRASRAARATGASAMASALISATCAAARAASVAAGAGRGAGAGAWMPANPRMATLTAAAGFGGGRRCGRLGRRGRPRLGLSLRRWRRGHFGRRLGRRDRHRLPDMAALRAADFAPLRREYRLGLVARVANRADNQCCHRNSQNGLVSWICPGPHAFAQIH